MRFIEGLDYDLVDKSTLAKARFTLAEVYQYRGTYICMGYSRRHEERSFRGMVSSPERLSAFVVLPDEDLATIATLTELLLGLPIVVRSGSEELPVVNMANIPGFWSGLVKGPGARESLLQAQRAKVDLYRYWKEHAGALPGDFLQAKAKFRGYGVASNIN